MRTTELGTIEIEDILHIIRDVKSTIKYIHSDLGEMKNLLYVPETKRIVIIDFESGEDLNENNIKFDLYTCGMEILVKIYMNL